MTIGITVNVNEVFEGKVISDNLVENFLILFDSKVDRSFIFQTSEMSDELYRVLPATPLDCLPYVMHQHIDRALISAFVESWQPDTNTFHMPWGR